jgi:hypothetical protein
MRKEALIELTLVSSKLVDCFSESWLGSSVSLHLEYLSYPAHQGLSIIRVILAPNLLPGDTRLLGEATHDDAYTVWGLDITTTNVNYVEGRWHTRLDIHAVNSVNRSESVLK